MAEEDNQEPKTILTPDEYQNRLVDFYNQTLGQTGIDVGDDDDEDDDKDDTYVAPNIMPDSTGDSTVSNVLDIEYNMENIVNMDLPNSYEDHLASLGRDDKSDLGRLNKSIQDSNKKINNNLQENFGISIGLPDQKQLQKYTGTSALANVFGFGGMPVALASSFIAGKTEKNIFGVSTFKPSGIPGMVQDVSESLRLDSYNKNKAAYTKIKNNFYNGAGEFSEVADFDNHLRTKDFGFDASYRGSGGSIYRTEGSKIYNGVGMIGLDQETARRIEALGKGYRPIGFDPTNPSDSESLVSTGTGKKSLSGYDEFGYHHSVKFGSAGMGRMKDAEQLAKEWGLDITTTRNALEDVRNRRSFTGRTIEGKTLTQVLTEARDRKQQKQQQQQQSDDESKTVTTKEPFSPTNLPPQDPFYDQSDGDSGNDYGLSDSDQDTGGYDSGGGFESGEEDAFASGGRIGMQEGDVVVKEPGFISPDANATKQQEIADDKPMDAKNGDFIINAPAAEDAGKQDIQRMINTAIKNLKEKGVDVRFGDPKINIRDKVKLLVSRNEVYIPAIIAKEIGYDRLKKINNRGKREVQRRQEESQQDEKPQARGFIEKKEGDVVDVTQRPDFKRADYMGDRDFPTQLLASITGVYNDSQKANLHARDYAKKYKPKDNDRSEDSLRHILGGGYMSDSIFKLPGYTGYNMREFGAFMDSIVGKKGTDPAGEESRIDLNNNRYGRVLRQKYPDENEFKAKAIEIARKLSQGKKGPVIDGISPMLSLGAEETTRRKKQQIEDMEYQVN